MSILIFFLLNIYRTKNKKKKKKKKKYQGDTNITLRGQKYHFEVTNY